jgi:hypothetical protein
MCHLSVDIWDDLFRAAMKRQLSLKQPTSMPSSPRRKVSRKAKPRTAVDTSSIRRPTFTWHLYKADGCWDDWAETAGGFYAFADTSFHKNPQFLFRLIASVDSTRVHDVTVFIALMQKYRRELRRQSNSTVTPNWTIGFELYKLICDGESLVNSCIVFVICS